MKTQQNGFKSSCNSVDIILGFQDYSQDSTLNQLRSFKGCKNKNPLNALRVGSRLYAYGLLTEINGTNSKHEILTPLTLM